MSRPTLRPSRTRQSLLESLGSSMEAGLPPAEALEIYQRTGAAEAAKRLRDGASLHEALTEQGLLDPSAAALVEAGETSGQISQALVDIGAELGEIRKQLSVLALSCAYPVFLLVAATFIMPFPKLILEGFGAYMTEVVPPILIFGLPVAGLTWALATGRLNWARLLAPTRRIPGLRKVHEDVAAGRLCRVTGRLLGAGLSVDAALSHAASALPYHDQTEALNRARAAIDSGSGFAASLAPTGLLPAETMSIVSSAEVAGKLEDALEERAKAHSDAASKGMKIAGAVASTALTLAVVLLVATKIVMTYMSILPGLGGGDLPPELLEMMR